MKWIANGDRVHDNRTGWAATTQSNFTASRIVDRHNDNIDALRAELARVKAESLRVVVVPDEGNLYDWYMTPTGLGYPGKDRKQNNCIESAEGYYRLDECKPVRLERWEDE